MRVKRGAIVENVPVAPSGIRAHAGHKFAYQDGHACADDRRGDHVRAPAADDPRSPVDDSVERHARMPLLAALDLQSAPVDPVDSRA